MKKITLLFTFLAISLGQAQSLPIDFDDTLDANFTTAGGAVFSVTADGTNAVGQIIGGTAQYDSRMDLILDTYIDMTTAAKTFTFKFYTTEAVVMNGLLQIGAEKDGGFAVEKGFVTDGKIGWETITIDFSDAKNGHPNGALPVVFGQYAQISVFTNFADTGTSTYWVDDIAGAANGAAVPSDPAPTTAATAPIARDAADVISLFSDAYTDVTVDTWSTSWDNVTLSDVTIANNAVKKYSKLLQVGIEHTGDNSIDASAMTHLSIDIWTPDATTFKVKLVDFKGDGYGGPNGRTESELEFPTTLNSWNTVNLKLSDFTDKGMTEMADISQMIFTTVPGSALVYVDNVYYYKQATAGVEDISANAVKMYPNPANGVVNFSTASNDALTVSVFDVLGKQVMDAQNVQSQLNISSLNPGMYFVKMTQGASSATKKLVVK
ncbi:T9SS type A sorting domain-containing protein [Flavobacteriaceae bacterium]|nr:T9SS type A sorting domain-containing protein [Flavobacteriaceae bacterium]